MGDAERPLTRARPGAMAARSSSALALGVVLSAQLLTVLNVSIVNVALPSIEGDLDLSATCTQWLVTAYTMTFGGLLIVGGRAGDLLGRRRLLLTGLILFSIASLVMKLECVMQGRVAAKFADGHVEYLSREIEREAKELQEGIPSHDIERQFNECKRQTESLAHEVASSKSMLMDKAALAEVEKRIVKIRETLQSTKSSL